MAKRFILDKDYDQFIEKDQLDLTVRTDNSILRLEETTAQEEMISFLNMRYDTSLIFMVINDWDTTTPFVVGDYAVENDIIYKCEVASTNDAPAANIYDASVPSGYWTKEDPRNPLMVRYMCAISLYLSHLRISAKTIPEIRLKEYKIAMDWLVDVAEGKLKPNLPPLADTTDTSKDSVVYGGQTKKTYTY